MIKLGFFGVDGVSTGGNVAFSHALSKLGFSDKKARVYLSLLQYGEMTASEIAKNTKLQRTTVYDILKELEKSGFVAFGNDDGKVKKFFAEGPEKLIGHVDRQAEELAEQRKLIEERQEGLKELIPQLRGLSEMVSGKPKIQFYDGAKGLVEALNDCLLQKKPIMIYGSIGAWKRWMPDHFDWYVKEIEKRRISVRQVDQKTIEKLRGDENAGEVPWDTRVLPVGFSLPRFSAVYGDKVLLASFQRPMATIIDEKDFAGTQKTIFELFWQFLR